MTPQDVADHIAITRLIHDYCRSIDRLDLAVGYRVFHAAATVDFPMYQGSGRGWIDTICAFHRERFLVHSHQVTNIQIDLMGDTAGSESYVTARLREREGGGTREVEFCARYVDRWSRRDGAWAIDHRKCIVDFAETRAVSPLEADPRSARDRSDPSYDVLREVR